MMADKKEFSKGLGMMAGFAVVLIIIFSPVFKGQNGLEYLDAMYNSISKGSAYYIPQVRESTRAFNGDMVDVHLKMQAKSQAREIARIFTASGVKVNTFGMNLVISGDLGRMIGTCLDDAEAMYNNNEKALSDKYGREGRQVLFNWWTAFQSMDKALKDQKKFKESKAVALVTKKGIECAYNYYGIEPKKINDSLGVVVSSLIFYVIYTLWYGFAVMFMFQGWGMKLEH